MSTEEVLVIGAGPFGLSISAHLHALGISHQIVGKPNGTYRAHVPVGMNMKSEPYASDMAAPQAGYRIGVRTRWLHGDMRWLRDNQSRVGRPDSVSRTRALSSFVAEFVRTRHLDCVDWRDLRPALAELRATTRAVLKSRN